jgi:Zn-dependent protease
VISAKITELGQLAPNTSASVKPVPGQKSPAGKAAAGIGALGLMLLKFKTLLLGLTKASTLLSMLLSLGVYWTLWGWKFALGMVLSIYVHEMGHVIALKRLGFKAGAPMFIPGLGALIRLKQQVVNPKEDAEIGLAGPIYGLGAALITLGIWYFTQRPIFAVIAAIGAWINLFNLLPIAMLDGGRGFHALSRPQKFLAAATVAAVWFATRGFYHDNTGDGMLMLVGLVCLGRAVVDKSQTQGSWKTTLTYAALVIALTAISLVRFHAGVPEV